MYCKLDPVIHDILPKSQKVDYKHMNVFVHRQIPLKPLLTILVMILKNSKNNGKNIDKWMDLKSENGYLT